MRKIKVYMIFLLLMSVFLFSQCTPKNWAIEHYENGKIRSKGAFSKGKKIGFWDYYNASGVHEYREKWVKNEWQWTIFYTPKHRKAKIIDKTGKEIRFKDCGCNP